MADEKQVYDVTMRVEVDKKLEDPEVLENDIRDDLEADDHAHNYEIQILDISAEIVEKRAR